MPTPNADSLSMPKGKGAEMGQKVVDKLDENRGAAASGLESAASALREKADTLPGGEKVANAAHSTAEETPEQRPAYHDIGRNAREPLRPHRRTPIRTESPGPAPNIWAAFPPLSAIETFRYASSKRMMSPGRASA